MKMSPGPEQKIYDSCTHYRGRSHNNQLKICKNLQHFQGGSGTTVIYTGAQNGSFWPLENHYITDELLK